MNYIVLDFETTGVDVFKDLPVQVACCIWNSGYDPVREINEYIYTGTKSAKGAEKIHGISENTLEYRGKSLTWLAKTWNKLVWDSRPVTVLGYNIINFDWIILNRIMYHYMTGRFKFPPVEAVKDVMFIAQRHFRTNKWPKLGETINRLEIPHDPDALHDAMYDVKMTWEVYKRLKNGVRK